MADPHKHALQEAQPQEKQGMPPQRPPNLVNYVLVDLATEALVSQGYIPKDKLREVANTGFVAIETSGVVDFTQCKYEKGAIVPLTEPPNALIDSIEVADDLSVTFDAYPGTKITHKNGMTATEANGKITLRFPRTGTQLVKVETPGYLTYSRKLNVVTLAGKKQVLKTQADAERDASLKATVTVDGNQYRADDAMQITALTLGLQALQAQIAGTAFVGKVITADNKVADLNSAQVLRLVAKIAKTREDVFIAARAKKDRIETETQTDPPATK